jgi:putative methyltransferase (TIGR04325 family)
MIKRILRKGLSCFYRDKYKKYHCRYGSGWSGNYHSWESALTVCTGYDDARILKKVLGSILETKDAEGVYERDSSVITGEPEFAFNALEWIMKCACQNKIDVIDFGGSLGSTYFQLIPYLSDYEVSWNIIEQKHFVSLGKKNLENDELKFFTNIDDIEKPNGSRIFFSSSTLQYLPEPFVTLRQLRLSDYEYLIFDRISVLDSEKDRLTVQVVPPSRYKSIYPCWFLSENNFVDKMSSFGFDLIDKFSALGGKEATKKIENSGYKGFFFESGNLT